MSNLLHYERINAVEVLERTIAVLATDGFLFIRVQEKKHFTYKNGYSKLRDFFSEKFPSGVIYEEGTGTDWKSSILISQNNLINWN